MRRRLLIIAALLLASPSYAAIDCVDANRVDVHEGTPGTSESIAYTTPSGSNQITFVGIGGRSLTPPTISNVQIGGQAMTVTPDAPTDTGEGWASLWYLVNPPSGTNNVTFTLSADPTSGNYMMWTCYGVDTADPFRSTPVRANGTSDTPTVTVTSANPGDVIVDFFVSDFGTPGSTQGANQTVIHEGGASGSTSGASWKDGANGPTTIWTMGGSDDWQIIAAALKSAPDADSGGDVIWVP